MTVNNGTVLTDCIVRANTTVGPNTTIKGGLTDVVRNDTVSHDVTVGENVNLGAIGTIQPGALVGNDVTIGDATVVAGRIDDDTHITRG